MNYVNNNNKRIFYAETNYDQNEIDSVNNALKNQSFSLVGGSFTEKFEKKSVLCLEKNMVFLLILVLLLTCSPYLL